MNEKQSLHGTRITVLQHTVQYVWHQQIAFVVPSPPSSSSSLSPLEIVDRGAVSSHPGDLYLVRHLALAAEWAAGGDDGVANVGTLYDHPHPKKRKKRNSIVRCTHYETEKK